MAQNIKTMAKKKKGEKVYILQRDIVIPAGTKFDNFSRESRKGGYYTAVVPIGKDCAEYLDIGSMDEILQHEPTFFKEEE